MPSTRNSPDAPAAAPADEGKKEHELYEQRLASAQKWRELGANPYGNGFKPSHLAAQILEKHADPKISEAQARLEKADKAQDKAASTAVRAELEGLVAAANASLTAAKH